MPQSGRKVNQRFKFEEDQVQHPLKNDMYNHNYGDMEDLDEILECGDDLMDIE